MWSNATVSNASNLAEICYPEQREPQHWLFQLSNVCSLIAFLAPADEKGLLFMHTLLVFGFFLSALWAWGTLCSLRLFFWNFLFQILNLSQALHTLYKMMRKVKFPPELEESYQTLFQPLQVSRESFKKLIGPDCGQLMHLQPGEAYAMQGLTKTDRLGLLVKGKANVISGQHFLHCIHANEFLDSPEFESSRSGGEEIFKVSVIATSPSCALVWQRHNLEYLLIKETHLSNVMSVLLSRDITRKLYAMNDKMVTEKGSHLDIRLPSLTGSIASQEEEKKVPDSVFGSREFPPAPLHRKTESLLSE